MQTQDKILEILDRELIAYTSWENSAYVDPDSKNAAATEITKLLVNSGQEKATIKQFIENRINELIEADKDFCGKRWDMSKPEFVRKFYREHSNMVTFARQVLQRLIKSIDAQEFSAQENEYLVEKLEAKQEVFDSVVALSKKYEAELDELKKDNGELRSVIVKLLAMPLHKIDSEIRAVLKATNTKNSEG